MLLVSIKLLLELLVEQQRNLHSRLLFVKALEATTLVLILETFEAAVLLFQRD